MSPHFFQRRGFALLALLSVFSLLVIPTGDPSWLVYLVFLGFLLVLRPAPRGTAR
jgi:hypothetical protein